MSASIEPHTSQQMSFEDFSKEVESYLSPAWRIFAEKTYWDGKPFEKVYETELRECYESSWTTPQGLAGAIMYGL